MAAEIRERVKVAGSLVDDEDDVEVSPGVSVLTTTTDSGDDTGPGVELKSPWEVGAGRQWAKRRSGNRDQVASEARPCSEAVQSVELAEGSCR